MVRQTVSKWEKGLSVPDADALIRLAEVLEVSVSELLGAKIGNESAADVAEQLSRINEQLAIRNRRSRRIWKAIAIILATIVVINAVAIILFNVSIDSGGVTENDPPQVSDEVIEVNNE